MRALQPIFCRPLGLLRPAPRRALRVAALLLTASSCLGVASAVHAQDEQNAQADEVGQPDTSRSEQGAAAAEEDAATEEDAEELEGASAEDGVSEDGVSDEEPCEPGLHERGLHEDGENGSCTPDNATEPDTSAELELNLDALAPGQLTLDLSSNDAHLNHATANAGVSELQLDALSTALAEPAFGFDGLSFIGATRSIVTGVFEIYCAANSLLPGRDGLDAVDVVLGVGCAIGATTLFVLGGRKLVNPRERREALPTFREFSLLRERGEVTPDDVRIFEDRLSEAARRGQRSRRFEIAFGVLNLVATATLAGLTARGRVERVAGITIASGTGVLGVMGLMAIFARSPADRALREYQALY